MCSGRNGGWGNSGESDLSGIVRPAGAGAATVAPVLVTAAVPRDLRVDPCEEKSKRHELRRMRQRSVDGRGRRCGSGKHGRSTFYSGKEAAKFAEMCTSG